MHAPGSVHSQTKGLTVVLFLKLLAVLAIIALLWLLELQFEIGATALVLLHLALAGALVLLAVRSGILGRRRK